MTTPTHLNDLIKQNSIVKCYAGSIAYGTNLPTSDVDFRGIFVADPISIRTPFSPIGEAVDSNEEDTKFYELNKFVKLAMACNPNVIELLWVNPEHVTIDTPEYQLLRQHAPQLLSKQVAFTTRGYAMSQLKRIKGHNKWITQVDTCIARLNELVNSGKVTIDWVHSNFPDYVTSHIKSESSVELDLTKCPDVYLKESALAQVCDHPPKQIDYIKGITNLTREAAVSNIINAWDTVDLRSFSVDHALVRIYDTTYGLVPKVGSSPYNSTTGALNITSASDIDKTATVIALIELNEDHYSSVAESWKNYHHWKEHRNPDRSKLEEEFLYDTKHAMHLIRLLRMGEEALRSGVVNVYRHDRDNLLAIRRGEYTYDEILDEANTISDRIDQLIKTTKLRSNPDIKLAAQLIIQIQDSVWNKTI